MLTRSTGEGHNRVSRVLQAAFAIRGHHCEVLDAVALDAAMSGPTASLPAGQRGSDHASRWYEWSSAHIPFLFGLAYEAGGLYDRTRLPSPVRAANAGAAGPLAEYIRERAFDVVVATHLFPQETLAIVRRRHPGIARCYGVLTDYSCTPFFAEGELDRYFVPHADVIADCVRHGMPLDRLAATGLPVAAAFARDADSGEARARLGLPRDVPVLLVMAGGGLTGRVTDLSDGLMAGASDGRHLVVLTGRRPELTRQLEERYRDEPRLHAVGFTDHVSDYMAAADVLVSKAGAVSSTEAAIAGLPLVHSGVIPGGETRNARFFAERGMSSWAQRWPSAVRAAEELLVDESRRAAMRAAQAEQLSAGGAERVVAAIEAEA